MESNGFRVIRWILIILAIFLMIALVIFIVIRPASNNKSSNSSSADVQTKGAMEFSTTGTFIFIQDGNVSAPETHQKISIQVSKSSRNISIYKGYGTAPTLSTSFANTQDSFNAFLEALNGAGFMTTRTSNSGSLTGSCTLGIRYIYQINNNTETLPLDTWGNNCNTKQGTFGGDVSTTQQLFIAQIPDYNSIVSGVIL